MAILGSLTKQPREIVDFDISFTGVLAGRVDTLTTATAEVTPTGLTMVSTTVVADKVKVKISGGTDAITYKVTVLTDTSSGLKFEDEVNVIVGET